MNSSPSLNELHWKSIAIGLGLLLCQVCAVQGEDRVSFEDAVHRYFNRWSSGGSGILAEQRVNELVLNRDIRGAEAAAIAAIHLYQHKIRNNAQPLTRDFLVSKHKENLSSRRDQAGSGANVLHNYYQFLKHIKSAPRKVFAVERPSLDTITQGNLGDCYFVAAVGALAYTHPEQLLRMINQNSDHNYEIQFPNGKSVTVPKLTDAQLALGSNAGQQGVWLNVLEVAAGMVRTRSKNFANETPLDALGAGGDPAYSIQLLTGHTAVKHTIRKKVDGKSPMLEEAEIIPASKQIGRAIRDGLRHQRIVCCDIGNWDAPPGLINKHAYAILGIKQGQVEVWNPWGYKYQFEPKGKPGIQNGYYIEGGRFSVPLQDFVKIFNVVSIESENPQVNLANNQK